MGRASDSVVVEMLTCGQPVRIARALLRRATTNDQRVSMVGSSAQLHAVACGMVYGVQLYGATGHVRESGAAHLARARRWAHLVL